MLVGAARPGYHLSYLPSGCAEDFVMADAPTIDAMLRQAFARVNDEDARLFYDYFDELKRHVRKYLTGKARFCPGESHVAQSALFSLFSDLTVQDIPLQDVDEYGYPMLWPLLLKYVERHCEKWKKYYRAKKRAGVEVPLRTGEAGERGIDPPDYRAASTEEDEVGAALEELYGKLTPRQRRVADLSAQGKTLAEIAAEIGCSESLVSLEKKAIRRLLETA
jgi:RNA polymerase sigma factor (sigma-70 family)